MSIIFLILFENVHTLVAAHVPIISKCLRFACSLLYARLCSFDLAQSTNTKEKKRKNIGRSLDDVLLPQKLILTLFSCSKVRHWSLSETIVCSLCTKCDIHYKWTIDCKLYFTLMIYWFIRTFLAFYLCDSPFLSLFFSPSLCLHSFVRFLCLAFSFRDPFSPFLVFHNLSILVRIEVKVHWLTSCYLI